MVVDLKMLDDEILEHNPCPKFLVTSVRNENGLVRGRDDDLGKGVILIDMLPEKISDLPISLFCFSSLENRILFCGFFSFICIVSTWPTEWMDIEISVNGQTL